jgi:hypothetical protein
MDVSLQTKRKNEDWKLRFSMFDNGFFLGHLFVYFDFML